MERQIGLLLAQQETLNNNSLNCLLHCIQNLSHIHEYKRVGIDINQYNKKGLFRDQNKVYKLKEVKEMSSWLFKRQRTFQSIFMAGMAITV